ncbi:hypothetical protein LRAMOSA11276 [Lichtheimia ramosa]|uniref:Proteasome assembly chaperone 1 n=1 Tax=Lichtheimia ramosa TaxID=688394 RepID=A0A077WTX9_9FUNG|nr:hypothetical protein LRAMOSA11276 [Lichtheimia ramosa]
MDFDEPFPSAPVRYAFDNDDSDVENEVETNLRPIDVNLTSTLSQPVTLLVGMQGPGSAYIEALKCATQHIGDINDCPILQISEDVLCIPLKKKVEREQVQAMSKSITGLFKLKSIILLDSLAGADYISNTRDITPPFLRVLQTSNTQKLIGDQLEPPNMIQDLTAALISYCEIHGIPGYVLLSLQESYLGKHIVTIETVDAYEDGLRKIDIARLEYDKNKIYIDEQPQHRLYL